MPRDYKLYLDDILQSIRKIQDYTAGLDYTAFAANDLYIDAVVRNLEIIGEAAKQLPPEVRAQSDAGEWRKIAGFRDIVAHEYFGVNLVIVWDIIQHKLPALRTTVETLSEAE